MPDLDLGEIENRFEGAATAATTAAQTAFDRAFEDNPLTAPDLGLTDAANRALESANVYRGAARDLAEGARAPLESWQALRDAVRATDEASADALDRGHGSGGAAGDGAWRCRTAPRPGQARRPELLLLQRPATEAAVTGWQAVTAALSDYASKARDIGGDIGQSLVGAFQSAENAVGQFVRTGKLDFRDLVTSLLADLAQLAARRFILGPIANALSGVFAGAGGIFANVLHAGGMVGSAGPSRMVPAMAFAAAPRMHGGGMAGLRHDEVPAILQRGERVLSRREAQSYGAGGGQRHHHRARRRELPPISHAGRGGHRSRGVARAEGHVMAFHEVRFPDNISRGARGGPERRTQIVELASGDEERNASWANSRRRYDVAYGIRRADDLAAVVAFFEARNGRLHGFRFKDWGDHKSCLPSGTPSPTDQVIGTGDGTTTEFQLVKRYASGAQSWMRAITKPVAGTVRIALGGVEQPSGWSVDTTTGVVSFGAAPAAGVAITAGFEFDVPVRFDTDALDVTLDLERLGSITSIPLLELRR